MLCLWLCNVYITIYVATWTALLCCLVHNMHNPYSSSLIAALCCPGVDLVSGGGAGCSCMLFL